MPRVGAPTVKLSERHDESVTGITDSMGVCDDVPSMSQLKSRCWWCGTDPLYVKYHDTEWGVPVLDDRALFEKLVLDGFQAGLSWLTILRKRDAFQKAFHGFRPEAMARYGSADMKRLLANAQIVRSRAKIQGAVGNAKVWLSIMEQGQGAFRDLLWSHVDGKTCVNKFRVAKDYPAVTPESEAMARTLKKLGFKFCGPTICYAFMQAVGMTNDHVVSCFRHAPCARKAVKRIPTRRS
jgi:DNA-3-methyladenine glycosylase I